MIDRTTEPPPAPAEQSAERLPEHYIEAETSLLGRSLRTLKGGESFAVLDAYGDIGRDRSAPEGLFYRDTRYLSRLELSFDGKRPLLLGSVIQDDNAALTVDLANPDVDPEEADGLPRNMIAISRTKFLWLDACYERIGLRNFDTRHRSFRIDVRFDADFRDLFEVRGMQRPARGRRSVEVLHPAGVEFRYDGLDAVVRRTRVTFEPCPHRIEAGRATFDISLDADERRSIIIIVTSEEGRRREPPNFLVAFRDTRRALRTMTAGIATVRTSNALFNEIVCRSTTDLYTLMTHTNYGLYPYAGIPWYSTVFGRDGIITAMLLLWMDPSIARGVLRYLAATQATGFEPEADAQPGKIVHERRFGEMARRGEVPFGLYYGTVDATPLFVMLAGMYFRRTGDRPTIEKIWPNIEAALWWCNGHGDPDRDGFVEYRRETDRGLENQGWKDSHDAVFHADGKAAEGPIALCEVQGYVYAAKREGARIAQALGHARRAAELNDEAEGLRVEFDRRFWCDDIGTYALALDGSKRPCRVRTSNAGHTLLTGIALPGRARLVADTLLNEAGFSGWGIRTLAHGEPRYNPVSYHNGSIWPHDNTLIALGFARYGLKAEAVRVFEAMFDAASYQELRRLPELFCGFIRRRRRGPTGYPVACSPQAWAAAAPFGFLEACLGLDLPHEEDEIRLTDPVLPDFLNEVIIRGVRLGSSKLDLRLHRHGHDVTVNILNREGGARLVLRK